MKKNIIYVLLILVFTSGGVIALANSSGEEIELRVSATSEPWPPVDETEIPETTESPTLPVIN
ncbi:MAG: hypothetical protein LBI27_08985, partial [Clostridiales bacterium]|nr:hypothetical protein [Clostridiales bacterium]